MRACGKSVPPGEERVDARETRSVENVEQRDVGASAAQWRRAHGGVFAVLNVPTRGDNVVSNVVTRAEKAQ